MLVVLKLDFNIVLLKGREIEVVFSHGAGEVGGGILALTEFKNEIGFCRARVEVAGRDERGRDTELLEEVAGNVIREGK